MNNRMKYLILFIILLIVEVLIALFIHDNIIRPYIGDVLVVIVIYLLLRVIKPVGIKYLPIYIFIFSCIVEILQYFNIVNILGLGNSNFFRILIGGTFDIKDILCYLFGTIMVCTFNKLGLI